jgi:hypothetical protein
MEEEEMRKWKRRGEGKEAIKKDEKERRGKGKEKRG